MACLEGKIFVIQGAPHSISFFTMEDNYSSPNIKRDNRFRRLMDIVACHSISMLYILDEACIWQLDKKNIISKYVDIDISPVFSTMSISGRDLLVTSSDGLRMYRYKSFGRPSPVEIRLPVGLLTTKPWHALEVDGWYVIAHIEGAKFHRVSKFEASQLTRAKLEVFTYGKKMGADIDQLSNPVYVAVEPKHGHIFVADHDNRRVVVLDRELKRVFTISDLPSGCYPTRLCYLEKSSELLVGMTDGCVVVYKFCRYVLHCKPTVFY